MRRRRRPPKSFDHASYITRDGGYALVPLEPLTEAEGHVNGEPFVADQWVAEQRAQIAAMPDETLDERVASFVPGLPPGIGRSFMDDYFRQLAAGVALASAGAGTLSLDVDLTFPDAPEDIPEAPTGPRGGAEHDLVKPRAPADLVHA